MISPGERAEHYVNITETVDRKIAALRAHASQTAHMTDLEARIRSWGLIQSRPRGYRRTGSPRGYLVLDTR